MGAPEEAGDMAVRAVDTFGVTQGDELLEEGWDIIRWGEGCEGGVKRVGLGLPCELRLRRPSTALDIFSCSWSGLSILRAATLMGGGGRTWGGSDRWISTTEVGGGG